MRQWGASCALAACAAATAACGGGAPHESSVAVLLSYEIVHAGEITDGAIGCEEPSPDTPADATISVCDAALLDPATLTRSQLACPAGKRRDWTLQLSGHVLERKVDIPPTRTCASAPLMRLLRAAASRRP